MADKDDIIANLIANLQDQLEGVCRVRDVAQMQIDECTEKETDLLAQIEVLGSR